MRLSGLVGYSLLAIGASGCTTRVSVPAPSNIAHVAEHPLVEPTAGAPVPPGVREAARAAPRDARSFEVYDLDDDSNPYCTLESKPGRPASVDIFRERVPLGPGRYDERCFVAVLSETGKLDEDALRWAEGVRLPAGIRLLWSGAPERGPIDDRRPRVRSYLVRGEAIITGTDVAEVAITPAESWDRPEQALARVSLTPSGADRFAAATRRSVQRRVALCSDLQVLSVPIVQSEIPGGVLILAVGSWHTPQSKSVLERLGIPHDEVERRAAVAPVPESDESFTQPR